MLQSRKCQLLSLICVEYGSKRGCAHTRGRLPHKYTRRYAEMCEFVYVVWGSVRFCFFINAITLYVTGVKRASTKTLKTILEITRWRRSTCPIVPRNAIRQNTVLSNVCPTSVEPIVLIQSHFAPVIFLIARRDHVFEKFPARYPKILPRVMRGTNPRIVS